MSVYNKSDKEDGLTDHADHLQLPVMVGFGLLTCAWNFKTNERRSLIFNLTVIIYKSSSL